MKKETTKEEVPAVVQQPTEEKVKLGPNERQKGEMLQVSIGTAIPLEALLSSEKKVPYDFLYMNVRTLWRNFHGAYLDAGGVDFKLLCNEFLAELILIESMVETAIPGRIQPLFYVCSNKSMPKLFARAKIKEPTTEIQKHYHVLERKVFEWLMDSEWGKQKIKIFDCLVKGNNTKALVITHFPLDLLSYPTFKQLDLLESHTGVIKNRSTWINKITHNEDYRNLPFNVLTLQLLGDHSTQFSSMGIKWIAPILELAKQNHWSAATAPQKMRFDLDKMVDRFGAAVYKEMLSVKLR